MHAISTAWHSLDESANARVYSWRGYNSNVIASFGIFRTDRIPSLSRLPKELGREERPCERCGARTEHILYRVPKKVVLVYVKDHPENLHATCVVVREEHGPDRRGTRTRPRLASQSRVALFQVTHLRALAIRFDQCSLSMPAARSPNDSVTPEPRADRAVRELPT